jgi:hypothetical protein
MDGMSSKAKVYFFISATVFMVIFHITKSLGIWGNLISVFLGVLAIALLKSVYETISRQWKRSVQMIAQCRKAWKTLLKLSQLDPYQLDQFLTDTSSGRAKVFHLKPKLGLVQFDEAKAKLATVQKVPYHAKQTLMDLQQIEEKTASLPPDERKLVIFVSQHEQFFEPELLDALTGLHVPESAIQRNIFLNTDVIEVSTEGFAKHKSLFDRIEQILGLQYSHYLILYPKEPENVVHLKVKKPLGPSDDIRK